MQDCNKVLRFDGGKQNSIMFHNLNLLNMKTLEQFIDDQISKIRLHDSETIDFWGDYFTENLDDVSDEDMRAEMENVIDLEPFRFEGKFN